MFINSLCFEKKQGKLLNRVNIVALQNNVIQDQNIFIPRIKGPIQINTFKQVTEHYNNYTQFTLLRLVNPNLINQVIMTLKIQLKSLIFQEKITQVDIDLNQLIQEIQIIQSYTQQQTTEIIRVKQSTN
ncbi:hypothetical protein pb186bvf_013143 [Paramecium bursaria]